MSKKTEPQVPAEDTTGEAEAAQPTDEVKQPEKPVNVPKTLTDFDIIERLSDKQMETVIYLLI
jgi:hypothetical protein